MFASNLALQNDEVGLMPDTGAHDGLCGDQWARRQAVKCQEFGKKVNQQSLIEPRYVAGVGNGAQQANYEVELTTGMVDTDGVYHEEKFRSPCLENSGVPGLMGIRSLERNDALIRCKTGEIWFLGPGGVKIEPSPGSRHFQMNKSKSGHWQIPISRFRRKQDGKTSNMVMTTTGASDETPTTAGSESTPTTRTPASQSASVSWSSSTN